MPVTLRPLRHLVVLALLLGLSVTALAAELSFMEKKKLALQFAEKPATPELLAELQKGGFTVYMRHTKTDNTKPDRVPKVDLNDCSTQRPSTEEGRQLAAQVGEYIRKAGLHFSQIHISPMCRVKDTFAAAFPDQPAHQVDERLMYVSNMTAEEKAPIIAHTRELLSTPVAAGENRLLIAHAPNIMELMSYFPKEATLVILRPKGVDQGFDYVASIPPTLWPQLVK
jgi:phosphohistidine phosphatase SixA